MGCLKGSAIQILSLKRNWFEDIGAKEIGNFLNTNKTLLELNLSDNELTSVGIKPIADALQHNNTLQILDLSNIELICAEGAIFIAKALMVNHSLLTLNMCNIFVIIGKTNVGNEGAKALGQALMINRTLEKLILSDNGILESKEIADSLKSNNKLQTLFLPFNELNNNEITHFTEVLPYNRTLRVLDLSIKDIIIGSNKGNSIGTAAIESIRKVNVWLDILI